MVRGAFLAVIALFGVCLAAGSAAGAYNFADFTDLSGSRPFTFTNNGGTSGTISLTAPVTFNFTVPTGLGTNPRAATLTITTLPGPSSTTPASALGSLLDQPVNNLTTLTLTEVATGKKLLGVSFTGDILGLANSPNAQLSGADSNGQTVQFTSDYLTFTQPGNSYALSLAAITPTLSGGPGGFLNSFAADITGQFVGDAIPEPAVIGLLALAPLALIRRRGPIDQ